MLILSPIGSKALSIGVLMAAYEADLPVLYVESMGYSFNPTEAVGPGVPEPILGEIVHVWLAGDPYPAETDRDERTQAASPDQE